MTSGEALGIVLALLLLSLIVAAGMHVTRPMDTDTSEKVSTAIQEFPILYWGVPDLVWSGLAYLFGLFVGGMGLYILEKTDIDQPPHLVGFSVTMFLLFPLAYIMLFVIDAAIMGYLRTNTISTGAETVAVALPVAFNNILWALLLFAPVGAVYLIRRWTWDNRKQRMYLFNASLPFLLPLIVSIAHLIRRILLIP